MDIGRTEGVGGPDRIEGNKRPPKTESSSSGSLPPTDKVEISERARLISELTAMPASRAEKIEQMRQIVESGEYETDERLEGAIDNFLRENDDLLA